MRALAVLAAFLLLGSACPKPDDCTPNETRCYNNRAQICGTDQRWRTFMDCEEIGGQMIDWTCCWMPENPDEGVPAGCTCVEGFGCPGGAP